MTARTPHGSKEFEGMTDVGIRDGEWTARSMAGLLLSCSLISV